MIVNIAKFSYHPVYFNVTGKWEQNYRKWRSIFLFQDLPLRRLKNTTRNNAFAKQPDELIGEDLKNFTFRGKRKV